MANYTDAEIADLKKRLAIPEPTDYGLAGAVGGGIGSLYLGNQANQIAGQNVDQLTQQEAALKTQMEQMPTLASMYGPDSSYAQQLAQTLARKDAAAGRNSQYGPRSVQLQAQLADKASQYSAQQAQAMNAYNTARNATMTARTQQAGAQQQVQAQQLASIFNIADKMGYLKQGNDFLKQMFNPNQNLSSEWGMSPNEGPQQYSDQWAAGPNAGPQQGGGDSGYSWNPGQSYTPEGSYQSNTGMGQMYGPADQGQPAPTQQNNYEWYDQ